jgi:hypothetical protein
LPFLNLTKTLAPVTKMKPSSDTVFAAEDAIVLHSA